ncbi:transcriptional regulator ATRX [Vigna radiata var. radiata]|uniref:Transcriptional regulator ATRX n=1 Tax=Vigna radiata var. radiata TaxID=3916 RepID=A0A1S3U5A5_VIGRR|nr:transcriptional regulator ATRX [Vigna radiata var. radiata]
MATTDKELEEQLLEAGNKLADPPSSVEELLSLLDQVESFLSKVEQSPSNSMQIALSPSLKALIADKLLRHSDDDVKVAVASCISEITRITAPDAPYDDDQMKEVFQLIVSSFENLHDTLSRSYAKRTSILETVAKVRSCVVMLDLECDALILEMFQHFFKAIREYHPENVFSSMETIMTLVLEESEDISLDLLSTLLARVKKDDEEAFPIAKKLGERVLESCATKLKPYLGQAVKSLGIPMGDYSLVLSSICQDTSDALEKNYTCVTSEHTEDKSELAKRPREESAHVVEKDAREVSSPSKQENPDVNISPKSVMSNGVACVEEGTALTNSKSIKKQEDAERSNNSEGLNISGHEVCNDLDSEKVDNSKSKPEQSTKRRRKKSSSSTKSAKLSKGQVAANDKETEKKLDHENNSKKVPSSPHEDHFVEAAGPSENDKEVDAKTLSSKVYNNESGVASPLSENLHDENRLKKLGRTKRKDGPVKDVAGEDVSKVSGGGASDSEAKPSRRSMKKALGQSSVRKASVVDSVKKGSGAATDADAKKHSAKKLDENKKGSGGSSSKQIGDKKKGGRTKANPETDLAKSTATNVDREVVSSPRPGTKSTKDESSEETPKANVKRKRSSGKENESDVKDYGENLVGLRVKVWWPEDQEFYKGVIHSFYSGKKKHKVLYDDGDEETLNLLKEKWKLIEAGSDADEEGQSDRESLDASTDMPPKKKGKTSADESTKQGKVDGSSKSGGAAASSRSKGASMKSSQKSKDGNKSKDSKTISKSEDRASRKSKDGTPKSGGSKIVAAAVKKTSNKSKSSDTSKANESKDDDTSKPKSAAKSKQETPKGGKSKQETLKSAISKGKPLKGGGKSDVNGTGKMKSGLKRKYAEDENSDA